MPSEMTAENRPNRAVEAVLPEDLELTPQPQPVEAPPPEMLPGDIAEDRSALAFLKVFKHRNYRLFFAGQLVSLMGTWITNVTQGWLVYSLTHSPLLLGVTTFAAAVPVFFFSVFGGALSDRFDKRRSLLVTQTLACVQSAILAILTLMHWITVWEIIALALFQGFINAFDVPIRQSMTLEMVGKDDLRDAISLNSMMFNLARVIGPTVGGILIAVVGPGICFSIDALSYGAVIVSLYLMRFVPRPAVKEGILYAWREREIRAALTLIAMCSAFGAAYLSLLPAFARDVLHQGSEGLGFLYTGVGAGAFLGAYALARVPDRHLFATPVMAALSFGVSLILFSQSHWFGLSLVLLLPAAFSLMLLGGSANSIVQLVSRDDMRGRVVALYAMAFLGMVPWGSLILGWVAEHFGTSRAVSMGGCICILAAIFVWHDRRRESWKLKIAE
jgi:MFS family permease